MVSTTSDAMELDPIEDQKDVTTKAESKDHAKHNTIASTRKKQPRKPKSLSSHVSSSITSSRSGIRKRSRESTDYSRRALERELEGLREEEREYRARLGQTEDEEDQKKAEKKDDRRKARRRVVVQTRLMRKEVEDISAKMGALAMGKEDENHA